MKISDRVIEADIGGCRLFMLPTSAESVVSFYGSFATRPDHSLKQDVLQDIAVALLDKGTTRRNKFEIAEELESRGAEIRFHSMATRIAFSGKCLTGDINSVFDICAEQLREPALHKDEFSRVLPRLQASVMQSMESTASQSGSGLRRMLFDTGHPNYAYSPETEMEILSDTVHEHVADYYRARAGANEFVLVVVGDFNPDDVMSAVRRGFDDWVQRDVRRTYELKKPSETMSVFHVPMKDKQNIDVRIGHAVDVKRTHDDYLPLYLGVFVLGGNFSSRLMDTIRDKEGLTYGIHAQLSGVSSEFCGFFLVQATFSSETLDLGIQRTNDLVREFAESGVSAKELASKKRTVAGSYKVGLASTGSLARTIGANIVSGLGLSYIDDFATLVEDITVHDVNRVVQQWIDSKEIRTSTAGTRTDSPTTIPA